HTSKNAYFGINVPAALPIVPLWNKNAVAHGWPPGRVVWTPYGITDVAPYVSQALQGGTQSAVMGSDNGDDDKLVAGVRQAGSNIPIVRLGVTTSQADLKAMGSSITNVYSVAQYLPPSLTSNAAVMKFNDAMNAVDSSAVKDDASEATYTGVELFAAAAKLAGSLTPAGIEAALNTHTFNLGLLPAVQFSQPAPGCGYPRCFNDWFMPT